MVAATLRRLALAVLVLTLLPALARADDKDKAPSGADKARRQLDGTVTLEQTDQPLSAALKNLRERADLNLVVDRAGMMQAGLDPEQLLVSINLKDVKTKSALRALLAPHNLGYAIIGDTILVSTDELAMQRQLKQRVSVDVDKLDLAAALKQLSKETAANVVLDSKVPARARQTAVSLQMEDVPLETAVKLLAEAGGLKPVKVGNVYLVTTRARANEMLSDPELNPANNPQAVQQNPLGDLQQLRQLQLFQNQAPLWANGNLININPNTGLPVNGPNVPIPPLEKPAEKNDESGDDDKPATPMKPLTK